MINTDKISTPSINMDLMNRNRFSKTKINSKELSILSVLTIGKQDISEIVVYLFNWWPITFSRQPGIVLGLSVWGLKEHSACLQANYGGQDRRAAETQDIWYCRLGISGMLWEHKEMSCNKAGSGWYRRSNWMGTIPGEREFWGMTTIEETGEMRTVFFPRRKVASTDH